MGSVATTATFLLSCHAFFQERAKVYLLIGRDARNPVLSINKTTALSLLTIRPIDPSKSNATFDSETQSMPTDPLATADRPWFSKGRRTVAWR